MQAGGPLVKILNRFSLVALAAAIVPGCGPTDSRLLDQGRIEFHPPEKETRPSFAQFR